VELSVLSEVFLVDAVRTPIGRAVKGSLVSLRPDDMAAATVRALVERTGIAGAAIDDLQLGCGYPEGEQGYNLGRRVGLLAGLPSSVPGSTVSRMCASSLQAVRAGAHAIATGEANVHLAVGVESITRVGRTTLPEHRHPDLNGERYPDVYVSMGVTAENVAREFDVSRADMDSLALASHQRAVTAWESGAFAHDVISLVASDGSVVTRDDGPRADTSLERIASLPPSFSADGTVTAGNSCPLSDGAAAVLMASARAVDESGLRPRARVLATSVSGVAPEMMGIGPNRAIRTLLDRSGLTMGDIDVVELNEAFAAQVIAVCRDTGIDLDRQLNPHGGAIALGHPFGMTGARLVGAVVRALEISDGHYGIATLCVGGGQGMAVLIERV